MKRRKTIDVILNGIDHGIERSDFSFNEKLNIQTTLDHHITIKMDNIYCDSLKNSSTIFNLSRENLDKLIDTLLKIKYRDF